MEEGKKTISFSVQSGVEPVLIMNLIFRWEIYRVLTIENRVENVRVMIVK
jgi:hypothetical protein